LEQAASKVYKIITHIIISKRKKTTAESLARKQVDEGKVKTSLGL